jgi:hypothetical protein
MIFMRRTVCLPLAPPVLSKISLFTVFMSLRVQFSHTDYMLILIGRLLAWFSSMNFAYFIRGISKFSVPWTILRQNFVLYIKETWVTLSVIRICKKKKNQSKHSASRLKCCNLLQKKGSYFCSASVTEALGQQHDPDERCVSVDYSKLTFKALLLPNGNEYPSVPAAYAIHMKISYGNVHHLWDIPNMTNSPGVICGDLKVIALTSEPYEVLSLFLRMGSHTWESHHSKKQWPLRQALTIPGQRTVSPVTPLVNPDES